MADVRLGAYTNPQTIVSAATAATAAPTANSDGVNSAEYEKARLFVTYGGTITDAIFRIHYWDGEGWYRGEDITGTPANGNSIHTFEPGERTRFFVQVATLTGTLPSVTIKVAGV